MNQRNFVNLILPAILVPVSVIVIINLLSGNGNQLGNTFVLLMVIGGFFALLAPKISMLLFVVAEFYTDFLKRLLILGDALSMQDVMTSLGLGPIIVIVVCFVCTYRCLTGKVPFMNRRDIVFFIGCIGVSLAGLGGGDAAGATLDFTATGQALLGSSMLGMSAFATYVLFRERREAQLVLKCMVLGAVPMALYAFYQSTYGISQWEEEYILTGISKVLYGFYMLDGVHHMRPFSTLNTHTSLGAISGTLFLIAAMIMTRTKALFQAPRGISPLYILLAFLFLGSCWISKNRTTYLLPVAGFVLAFMFAGGWRTLLFYILSISLFVWIVINSEWLDSQILGWSNQFESTAFGAKFGTLGTYQDRLRSFALLNQPAYWSPFGLSENERPGTHDQITSLLTRLGYVPLMIALAGLAAALWWWHRKCLRISEPSDRRFLNLLTAVIVTLGICGMAYGNMIFVAPVNSVLGILIGLGMSVIARDQAAKKVATANHRALAYPPLNAPLLAK